jgi:hypothetical protein
MNNMLQDPDANQNLNIPTIASQQMGPSMFDLFSGLLNNQADPNATATPLPSVQSAPQPALPSTNSAQPNSGNYTGQLKNAGMGMMDIGAMEA